MAFHSFAEITNFLLFYKRVASNQHDHQSWRRTTFAEIYMPAIAGDQVSYKMSTEQIMSILSGMILEAGGYIKSGKYEPLLGAQA